MLSPNNLPALSIVIITLNEASRLPRLLQQLEQQTYQNFQLIVSDSKSSDNTKEVAERYTGNDFLFYQCGVTKGPGYGRNRGAEQTIHDTLLFLDADTQFPNTTFLAEILAQFVKDNKDIAGCYLQGDTDKFLYKLGCWITNGFFFFAQYTKTPILAGGCILVKKSVHQHLGGFDETIYLGEDSEYAKQAKNHGYAFGILPWRFVFDMRRIEKKGIRHALRIYLGSFVKVILQKKVLRTQDPQKIEYEFDIYTKE